MFEKWFYYEERHPSSLPSWCHDYGEIGRRVAAYKCDNRCLCVALAVPTRAYAALFVAVGVVVARALQPEEQNDEAYFDMLWNLPEGTLLYYDDNNKRYKVRKKNVEERENGCRYLRLQLDQKGSSHVIPSGLSQRVTVIENAEVLVEPPNRKHGRKIPDDNEDFVAAALSAVDVQNFCRSSRVEVLFVGVKSRLEAELKIPLRIGDIEGRPQNILRVQHLLARSQRYRSLVDTDQRGKRHRETPHVVIFDSAKGFLDWRDQYRTHLRSTK